jgi:hypothetical protein
MLLNDAQDASDRFAYLVGLNTERFIAKHRWSEDVPSCHGP